MNIKLGILYPTRLSLYGDNANVKAIKHFLRKRGNEITVDHIDDVSKYNLLDYDFIYMGSGMDSGLKFAEQNLFENRNKIYEYIDTGRFFLITGNALSALYHFKLYDFITNDDYYVSDVVAKTSLCKEPIRAFQNTKYLIKDSDSPVFEIEQGYGNAGTKKEGFRKNNLIVTSLIGPILAINDGLLDYIIDGILERHEYNFK